MRSERHPELLCCRQPPSTWTLVVLVAISTLSVLGTGCKVRVPPMDEFAHAKGGPARDDALIASDGSSSDTGTLHSDTGAAVSDLDAHGDGAVGMGDGGPDGEVSVGDGLGGDGLGGDGLGGDGLGGEDGDGLDGHTSDGVDSSEVDSSTPPVDPCPSLVCADNNPCTDDSCEPLIGCVYKPNEVPCDDGDPCTKADHCKGGSCAPGPGQTCDDGNPCTDDSCAASGSCVHAFNTLNCSDGDVCTLGEKCLKGICSYGVKKDCDDHNPCTQDGCDSAKGCLHANLVASCDDGDLCTVNDECMTGICKGAPLGPKGCDDGESCTQDSCHPKNGCQHSPHAGSCDDGDLCTVKDACVAGVCKGVALSCHDDELCTDDLCEPKKGCVFAPNTIPCDDNDLCTSNDTCKKGKCQGVPAKVDMDGDSFATVACGGKDCNDANPLTYPGAPEICDGEHNDCDHLNAWEPCVDLDGDGFCAAEIKVIGKPPGCPKGGGDCSDGNPYAYPGAAIACLDMLSPLGQLGGGPCDLVGQSTSLHMAWRGSVFDDLQYSRITSGSVVETRVIDRAIGLGRPAIAVNSKGGVFVAYTNAKKKELHLSIRVGAVFKRISLGGAIPGQVGAAFDAKDALHLLYTGPDAALHEAVVVGKKVVNQTSLGAISLERGRALLSSTGGGLLGVGRGPTGTIAVFEKKGSKWVIESLKASPALGAGLSVARSPNGTRYVCFQDAASHKLRLAHDTGGKWSLVDVPGSGHFGASCQLSVDALGELHLVYEDESAGLVRHSRWSQGKWKIGTIPKLPREELCGLSKVGAVGMAIGQAGRTLASWTGSKWSVSDLEPPSICTGSADLAIDAKGHHHEVAWHFPVVCHATDTSGQWTVEKIKGPGVLAPVSPPAIGLDKSGTPLVGWSAVSGYTSLLQIVRPTQAGWKPEIALWWAGGGDGFGYPGPSITVTKDGSEHLVVLPHNSNTLRYAWHAQSGWKSELTAATGVAQSWADRVSFTVDNAPQVVYCTPSGELRHASRGTNKLWTSTVVEKQGCVWLSLAGSENGQITVLYSTGTAIRYALRDAGGWSTGGQNPPDLPLLDATVSSVVSAKGQIRAIHRTSEAIYYTVGKPGGSFSQSPILPATCQHPKLKIGPNDKVAVACGLRLFAEEK